LKYPRRLLDVVEKTAILTLKRVEILVPSALREDTAEEKRYHSAHLSH
jgi:hypothetical protein